MTIFKRISAVFFGAALMLTMTSVANAVLLDFSNAGVSAPTFSEDGFTFSASAGNVLVNGLAVPSTESEIAPNNLFGTASLILTQDGGGAFNLNSFEIELFIGFDVLEDFDFTIDGTKSDLSSVSVTLSDLTTATSVTAGQLSAFTDLTDVTFSATFSGIFQVVAIDDINVTEFVDNQGDEEVPEPGTLALLGIGLIGLAAFNRRRRLS